MNKKIIAIIGVFLLIIVGGVIFMMMKPTPQTQQNQPAATDQSNQLPKSPQTTTEATQTTSLKSLMTSGGNQKCSFQDTKTGSSGTTYISMGKMRNDITSQINGEATTSHMISDGQSVYTWMDNAESGYKISLSSMDTIKAKAPANVQSQQTLDMSQQLSYNCSSWSPDDSLFTVPADKKFQDMSAMMENAGKMMEGAGQKPVGTVPDSQDACAACDQAPSEETKTQCKIAMKCQ